MILSSASELSGVPTTPGTYSFTVRASDANNCAGTLAYVLTINCQTLTLDPATLPSGQFGQTYQQNLTQTGGVGTVTYSLTAGALPNRLTLSSAGLLASTPVQGGSYNFTVGVTDANGCAGSRAYTLSIGAYPALTLNPTTLSSGTLGAAYSQSL